MFDRQETIDLITEHAINQGIGNFEQFLDRVQGMSRPELEQQLAILEDLALNCSTMPQ